MKYPQFLHDNSTIGLLATSCGSNVNPYRLKTQEGIKYFLDKKYNIKRGHRVFAMKNAVSAPHHIRALDFNKMYKNKNIDFLWSTGGGEIMVGMLPYIDFEKIKWFNNYNIVLRDGMFETMILFKSVLHSWR